MNKIVYIWWNNSMTIAKENDKLFATNERVFNSHCSYHVSKWEEEKGKKKVLQRVYAERIKKTHEM